MRLLAGFLSTTLGLSLLLGGVSATFSPDAQATAAFARATGAKCNKCHTASFPRLTWRGERFMRNGYQTKKAESSGGFGLDDDEPAQTSYPVGLKNVSEIFSVTGEFEALHMASTEEYPAVGTPGAVGILATATIAKDTPIWAGVDVGSSGAEVHRYTIGRVNISDTTLLNLRMGTLDPTTWTSFYGHSGALDSAAGDIGAYGSGHHGTVEGFTTVGPGYAQNPGIEYYGYTTSLFWSAGIANGSTGEDAHDTTAEHDHGGANYDELDYWAMARYTFEKGSSFSALWYNANGAVEAQAVTLAGNLRWGDLDLRGQFTIDASKRADHADGHDHSHNERAYGFTIQADYALTRDVLGIYRFDTTGNGSASGIESLATLALVIKPEQNIKITAAYVIELDAAEAAHTHDDTATDTHDHGTTTGFGDHGTITVRYMF